MEQQADQIGGSSERDDHNIALHVNCAGLQPFFVKGKFNKQQFSAMIDSSSPKYIFTKEDFRRILKLDLIFARLPPTNEGCVDYNVRPLNSVGVNTVDWAYEN